MLSPKQLEELRQLRKQKHALRGLSTQTGGKSPLFLDFFDFSPLFHGGVGRANRLNFQAKKRGIDRGSRFFSQNDFSLHEGAGMAGKMLVERTTSRCGRGGRECGRGPLCTGPGTFRTGPQPVPGSAGRSPVRVGRDAHGAFLPEAVIVAFPKGPSRGPGLRRPYRATCRAARPRPRDRCAACR